MGLLTFVGLVLDMLAALLGWKILLAPAAIVLFYSFHKHTKSRLRWRRGSFRYCVLASAMALIIGVGLMIWSPSLWLAASLVVPSVVLAVLWQFLPAEEAVADTPAELCEKRGHAATDDAGRIRFEEHYVGRLYRVAGTVTWSSAKERQMLIKWRAPCGMNYFIELKCTKRGFKEIANGIHAAAGGRIGEISGWVGSSNHPTIILEGAKLFT